MSRLQNFIAHWRDIGEMRIAPRYLIIFLFPVIVLITAEYLLGNYGDHALDLSHVALAQHDTLGELAGRYRYMAAVFFYLAVSVSLILVFAFELGSQHKLLSILSTVVALFAAVGVALVFSILEPVQMNSFESYQLLGESLYRRALGVGKLAGCGAETPMNGDCLKGGAFNALIQLNGTVNIVSALASASVIAGMILALSRSGPVDLKTRDGLLQEAKALEASQAATRRYLYASGILLTVGMSMGLAWMNWPNALIVDDATRDMHGKLVDGVSLFRGVSYSVLIMSYYLPVSLVLMVRTNTFHAAAEAHGSDITPKELEAWDARIGGFDINKIASLDAMKAILAIVSPILTSALGSFGSLTGFG